MRRLLILFVVFGMVGVTVKSSGAIWEPSTLRWLRHLPSSPNAFDQHQAHASASASQRLTLETDGATTPEAISDELAYALFLRAMTAIKDPRGRGVALRAAGLDAADRAAFANALLPTVGALGLINEQRKTVTSDVLRATEQATLATARVRVLHALSVQGQALRGSPARCHSKCYSPQASSEFDALEGDPEAAEEEGETS